jgi:protein-serine/threonine kinase
MAATQQQYQQQYQQQQGYSYANPQQQQQYDTPTYQQQQPALLISPQVAVRPPPSSIIDYSIPLDFSKLTTNDLEKIRVLGKGDVGCVYLVHVKGYPMNAHLYAMKVLKKEDMIERQKVQRVLTERDILCTTKHPYIVSYYTSFQNEFKLFIIMEYCAGGEFFRFLQKQPNHSLSEQSAKFYAAEVLMALEYLHKQGIIYRDLKPENILLHESGHIRLTDFDLSKETGTRDLDDQETSGEKKHFFNFLHRHDRKKRIQQFNSFVGTAEYIAPEVITGFGYNASVDWWTFGILLYEMLYGKTPFVGDNMNDTFKNILHQKLNFPTNQGRNISRDCQDLIRKLLNPDQKKRLGHKMGARDIKSHPFFAGINWDRLQYERPPMIPQVSDPFDFSHFREDLSSGSESEEEEKIEKIYSVEDNLDELEKLNENNRLFGAFAYKPSRQLTPSHQSSGS